MLWRLNACAEVCEVIDIGKASAMAAVLALASSFAYGNEGQAKGDAQHRPQMPEVKDLKRVPLPSAETMSKAMEEAKKNARTSGTTSMQDASRKAQILMDPAAVARGMPSANLVAVPIQAAGKIDPLDLAKQYRKISGEATADASYNVIIFVSLSMPTEALKRIGEDARKVGALVVLRGLKFGLKPGTWADSMEAMKPLAAGGADVQINPELFKQFNVTAAPTVVVTETAVGDTGCSEGACATRMRKLVGDVSLEHALEVIGERNDKVGKIAQEALTKL